MSAFTTSIESGLSDVSTESSVLSATAWHSALVWFCSHMCRPAVLVPQRSLPFPTFHVTPFRRRMTHVAPLATCAALPNAAATTVTRLRSSGLRQRLASRAARLRVIGSTLMTRQP